MIVEKLCCPKCKNKLSRNNNELFCEKCRQHYSINGKMFDFSNPLSTLYKLYETKFGGSIVSDIDMDKEKYIKSTLRDERCYNLISNIDFNEGVVIDHGTGRGLIAGTLKKLKSDLCIIGHDISPNACISALNSGFIDYAICSDSNLPLVDNSVDGAIMGDLIEHLLDPEHFLNEVYRILRPSGILTLSTPNISFIRNRITMLKGEFPKTELVPYYYDVWNAQHLRFFNFYSIRKILYKCGFKNVKVKGVRLLQGKIPFKRILVKTRLSYKLPDNLVYEMMVLKAKKGKDFIK